MKKDLTKGKVQKALLLFAAPMILGNLLQQCYNIVDTIIVGRFLGAGALAAVGAAYSLMTFLTSVIIGLCMGSGAVFSFYFGKKDIQKMKESMAASFTFIGTITIVINVMVFQYLDEILVLLQIPLEVMDFMREYTEIIFCGKFFVFLFNYFSFVLRSIGNSVVPVFFLGISTVINVILDIWFIVGLDMGIAGAAKATIIAQIFAGTGFGIYRWIKEPVLRIKAEGDHGIDLKNCMHLFPEVIRHSFGASIQQSVMNFGILMIQGLVNSFGTAVMAAFAAAVKIDSIAYMPSQEYANAYSLFVSQNRGAGEYERVRQGTKESMKMSVIFSVAVSLVICVFAKYLMMVFVNPSETDIIKIGVGYLRIEGAFYLGIGLLFLLYGYYRGIGKPEMSLVLTVISLGTRVLLAYSLSPMLGVKMIWWAIPIGWFLADVTGMIFMKRYQIK